MNGYYKIAYVQNGIEFYVKNMIYHNINPFSKSIEIQTTLNPDLCCYITIQDLENVLKIIRTLPNLDKIYTIQP